MQWWCAAAGVPWTWQWRPYPGVWALVLLLTAGYVLLYRRFGAAEAAGPRGAGFGAGPRRAYALVGVLALEIALDWPVGALGAGYLASLHTVQFLLIALIAPPFLLLGVPPAAWVRLAQRMRAGSDAPGIARFAGTIARGAFRFVTHPISALVIFAGVMAWTHWPPVVDTLMATQVGNFMLDMLWLTSGLLFWWPVAAPVPERPWLTLPVRIGHLLAAMMVDTGVFAFLVFTDLPVYATFELAPPVSGLGARNDQMIAGFLMKLGGAGVLWTTITLLFFRWFLQSERDEPALSGASGPVPG